MTASCATVPLSRVLRERNESAPAVSVLTGELPIVAKIRFSDGGIELRASPTSKTELVLAKRGDLLVSGINALKGAIGLVPNDGATDVAATIHYSAYAIDETQAVPAYLVAYLRSNDFRRRAASQLPNGIKTELKAKRLLQISIPLPSLPEQTRAFDSLRSQRALVSQLLGRRTGKSQMLLGRRVTVGANARRLFAVRLGEMERSVAAQTEMSTLGTALVETLRHGPSFPCSEDGDGIRVLMPSSTTGFGLDTTKALYANGSPELTDLDLLEPGDIIFARGNKPDQVGTCGLYDGEPGTTTFANLFMRLRFDHARFEPQFAQYWLMTPSVRAHVSAHTRGTGPSIQKINGQGVRSIPFPARVERVEQMWWIEHLDEVRVATQRLAALEIQQHADLARLSARLLDDTFAASEP